MESLIRELNDILSSRNYEFSVKLVKVAKNNFELDGIAVGKGESHVWPVLYPDGYFMSIDNDERIRVLEEFYNEYGVEKLLNRLEYFCKDYIFQNVVPRLVSDSNADRIKRHEIVADSFLDMLVEYYVPIHSLCNDTTDAGYILRNYHLEDLDIDRNDLHRYAIRNLKPRIRIHEVNQLLSQLAEGYDIFDTPLQMYVVTVEKFCYGASAILDYHTLIDLGDILGNPFIIFPSSVHEVIAVSVGLAADLNACKAMVYEINREQLELMDRLTDSVYICEDGNLSVYS